MKGLDALVDAVIPADAWPGGWEGGVRELLARDGDAVLGWARPLLERAVTFARVEDLEREDPEAFAAVLSVTFEGYYAGYRGFIPPAWDMVGFRPSAVVEPEPLPVVDVPQETYDVVIVGAGAGGGVAAAVLAEAGLRVLLVERARAHTQAELTNDHLHGKRAAVYDPVAGPGPGHPRVLERHRHRRRGQRSVGLGAERDGGRRRHAGLAGDGVAVPARGLRDGDALRRPGGQHARGLAARLRRAGAVLRAGRVGDRRVRASDGPLVSRFDRARGYPMPPLASDAIREAFGAAADRLGWGWGPVPFAINSVPRAGRAACIHCSQCLGHASPVNAKNGTHNTVIPRALATGNCDLLVSAPGGGDRALGRCRRARCVLVVGGVEREVRCGRVVVCAGPVETPRLLLVSGLGGPAVGTNLHSHSFTMIYGTAREPLERFQGPGHSVATLDFVHRDGEAWGGGVLFDAPTLLPAVAAQAAAGSASPLGAPSTRRGCGSGCRISSAAWGSARRSRRRTRGSRPIRMSPTSSGCRSRGWPATSTRRRARSASYMAERVTTWLEEVGVEAAHRLRPRAHGGGRGALGGHVPDGGGPGDVGVRSARARARVGERLRRGFLDAADQRQRESLPDDDGQRLADRRGAQPLKGTTGRPLTPGRARKTLPAAG